MIYLVRGSRLGLQDVCMGVMEERCDLFIGEEVRVARCVHGCYGERCDIISKGGG